MSRNSRNRDIYRAKLKNSAQGDAEKMMQGLVDSPFRSDKRRADRILRLHELLSTVTEENRHPEVSFGKPEGKEAIHEA